MKNGKIYVAGQIFRSEAGRRFFPRLMKMMRISRTRYERATDLLEIEGTCHLFDDVEGEPPIYDVTMDARDGGIYVGKHREKIPEGVFRYFVPNLFIG